MMQTSMLQIKYDALESDLKHEWENAMRECKDTYLVCLKDESVMLQNCILQTEEQIATYKQELSDYRNAPRRRKKNKISIEFNFLKPILKKFKR